MRFLSYAIIASLFLLVSCKGVPGYVIKERKMAELLADMHMAEAVIDNDYRHFGSDSAKRAMKQAVLDKHGVTQEQFDTSLVWYGHNIGEYNELYDRTIDILDKRVANAGAMAMQQSMSMAGDSVDVWGGARFAALTALLPSRKIAFSMEQDENMVPGDSYTFRAKILDRDNVSVRWVMLANYSDSTVDYLSATSRPMARGWNEMTFVTDSTRQLTRLRGYFEIDDEQSNDANMWIDSISLVRKRLSPQIYTTRHRQRLSREY